MHVRCACLPGTVGTGSAIDRQNNNPGNGMQGKKGRLVVGLLAVIVISGAVWWWNARNQETSGADLVLHGNVDIRQVELAFHDSERIAAMLVQEGEPIKRGELLATLDTQRLEYGVANAEAQVAMQRQVLAKLEAGSRPEEIRKARADVAAAQATANNAERVARRQRDLLAKRLVSQQQADDAQAAAEAAQAQLKASEETLRLAVIGPRAEDIAAARATLQAYEAQLALARRQLHDAKLYAPADGIIQERILEPGDMASPQTPVYTIALTNPMWVRAYVDEPDLGRLRPGMKALISTDSFPGKNYRGWIGFISPTAEFTPKSVETRDVRTALVYQVRVYVCNPQGELRLGMPAKVTIPLEQASAPSGAEPCAGS